MPQYFNFLRKRSNLHEVFKKTGNTPTLKNVKVSHYLLPSINLCKNRKKAVFIIVSIISVTNMYA